MIHRHVRLFTVLFLAALVLILGLLVMAVTSCAPVPIQQTQPQEQPATPQVVASLDEDGTIYHPWFLDPGHNATSLNNWEVQTVHGHEQWGIDGRYDAQGTIVLHEGDYVWYHGAAYKFWKIDQQHHTANAFVLGN